MGAPAIITGLKVGFPVTGARDRQGVVYLTNGFNRPIVWDGTSSAVFPAGIKAPLIGPGITDDTGGGSISPSFTYYSATKYIDAAGRESELSALTEKTTSAAANHRFDWQLTPATESRVKWHVLYRSTGGQSTTLYEVIRLGDHGTITATTDTGGFATFTVPAGHGLQVNAVVTISGHSVAAYNTTHTVTAILEIGVATFRTNVAFAGAGTTQGSFVLTGYIDDGTADATLDSNASLAILNTDGSLNARRQGLPPAECAVCAWFQDRMYYAVQRKYSTGTVSTTAGTQTITGSGTAWIAEFGALGNYYATSKWMMQIANEPKPLDIFVFGSDTSLQTDVLTVASPTLTQTNVSYVLYPDTKIFRNTLIYSEVDEGESVPYDTSIVDGNEVGYINTITVQENTGDDDEITALMPYGYALFVLKERHIYRLQNVANTPSVYLLCARGCLNQRCWTYHDDMAYLMDSSGIYAFDGTNTQPISLPIQNLWRDGTIDFALSRWFTAVTDTTQEIVRFYVKFTTDTGIRPKRALCYHIRSKAWTFELYPWEIGGACKADVGSAERLLVGSEDENIYKTNDGYTDDGTTIEYAWRSGLFPFTRSEAQEGRAVQIAFQPTEVVSTLNARIYEDNNTTPIVPLVTQITGNGVIVEAGSADLAIQMFIDWSDEGEQNGWVKIPIAQRGGNQVINPRWMSLELEGEAPQSEQVKIYGVLLEGVQGPQ